MTSTGRVGPRVPDREGVQDTMAVDQAGDADAAGVRGGNSYLGRRSPPGRQTTRVAAEAPGTARGLAFRGPTAPIPIEVETSCAHRCERVAELREGAFGVVKDRMRTVSQQEIVIEVE